MRRREFLTALGGAAIWPLVAQAQQTDSPVRIGYVASGSPSNIHDQSYVESFRQGLRDVGLIEKREIIIDLVWMTNEPDYPRAVSELMQRGAKILVMGGSSAAMAAKNQTSTIPIILHPPGIRSASALSQASRTQAVISPGSATYLQT